MPTYYVRSVGGSDANDGLSFANGWATIQHSVDPTSTTGGDSIRICDDGPHIQTSPIAMSGTGGTSAAPIVLIGANADGSIVGQSKPIVRAGAAFSGAVFEFFQDADFIDLILLDIDANNNADFCIGRQQPLLVEDLGINFCDMRNAISHGVDGRFGNTQFFDCSIYNNGGRGVNLNGTDPGMGFSNSAVFDNGSDGIYLPGPNWSITLSAVYGNGGNGILINGDVSAANVFGNTIYGNAGSGIGATGAAASGVRGNAFISNSMTNNGVYGYFQGLMYPFSIMTHNHTHNNTLGPTDIPGGLPGVNNPTGDPYFRNVTPGSEDFTPKGPVSPLWESSLRTIGAQLTYSNIGAIQNRRLGKVGRDGIR